MDAEPERKLLASLFHVKIYNFIPTDLYEICDEKAGQAVKVDFETLKVLQQLLNDEFGTSRLP